MSISLTKETTLHVTRRSLVLYLRCYPSIIEILNEHITLITCIYKYDSEVSLWPIAVAGLDVDLWRLPQDDLQKNNQGIRWGITKH